MKLISWNVNGIRAVVKKGFFDFIRQENPDVLCIQETKGSSEHLDLPLDLVSVYKSYWFSAEKKGYSGTAVFSKIEPISVLKGMGKDGFDNEGRVLTMEFDEFYLVNTYMVNAQRGLARIEYKVDYMTEFIKFCKKLEESKPVVICGDLNVAHTEIDLANPKSNEKNAGYSIQERDVFNKLIDAGFVDTFRIFNKDPGHYTWWSYMFSARAKDIGWRIDYFLVSKDISSRVKTASILKDVMGSDHCPVTLELK